MDIETINEYIPVDVIISEDIPEPYHTSYTYDENLLAQLNQFNLINLNPRYILLSYDIDMVKDEVKKIKKEDTFLDACPQLTVDKNTLFYDTVKLKSYDDNMINISPLYDADEDVSVYFTTILPDYDDVKSNKNTDLRVLWNEKDLKFLDLSVLSVELGINVDVSEKTLVKYCKANNLDGYIDLTESPLLDGCFHNIPEKDSVCPAFHFINRGIIDETKKKKKEAIKNYKKKNLKVLSLINLKKKSKYIDVSDVNKLISMLLCKIKQLTKLTPAFKHHLLSTQLMLRDKKQGEHDLSIVFENMTGTFGLLMLNYINLYDTCVVNEINININININNININDINNTNIIDIEHRTTIPDIKNLEIFSFKNIHTNLFKPSFNTFTHYNFKADKPTPTYISEYVFDVILKNIASISDIIPFVFLNFQNLHHIPGYEQFTLLWLSQHTTTFQRTKTIMREIGKKIINQLIYNYRQTEKGRYRGNISFINLEYIPSTFDFIMSKILNQMNTYNFNIAAAVINDGEEYKTHETHVGSARYKSLTQYFNASNVYHTIISEKYKNVKVLYQDLLNDFTNYKKYSSLNIKFLSWVVKLNNENINDFLQPILVNLYKVYENYITDANITYSQLYDYLQIDMILQYYYDLAQQEGINGLLLLQFYDISIMDGYDAFKLVNIKKTGKISDIDDLIAIMDKLKTTILLNTVMRATATFYKMDITSEDTKKFLLYMCELFIKHNLEQNNSELRSIMQNSAFNWKEFLDNFNATPEFIESFETVANNNEMIGYIYNFLDMKLNNDLQKQLVYVLRHRNLLLLFVHYLNHDIDKDELKNVVSVQLTNVKNVINTKQSKKVKEKSESGSASMGTGEDTDENTGEETDDEKTESIDEEY